MRWPSAAWSEQTTRNVPARVNFRLNVTLVAVFDLKPGPLTLCGTLPLQDHLTVSPTLMRTTAGENRYFVPDLRTPTLFVAPSATVADAPTITTSATPSSTRRSLDTIPPELCKEPFPA